MAEEKVGAKYVLRAIPDKCYEEAIEAKARGEMIGWSASNFPQEITTALGIPVVYPESQAAQIAAKRGALPLLEHAEGDLGYSNDLCAYARISLAYADVGECPNGERDMPLPDFVLCCNNICNCMMKWYENLGRRLGIPVIMIDVPYSNDYDIDEKRIRYVGAQFRAAIRQLEDITGKKWDEDKFQEVCRRSSECGRLWLEAASYTNYKPSPVNGFELFNHMAVATVARGREEDCRRVGLAGGDGRVDRVDVLEVAVAAEVPVDPCEKRLGRDGLQDMQQDRREAREDHRTPVQEFGGEEAVAFLYGEQQGAHVQQEGILVRIQVLDGGRYEYRDFRLQLFGQVGVPRRREVGAPLDALHLREFIGGWRCRARVVHDAGFAPGEGVDGCRLGRLDLDVEDILCHCRPPC